MFIYRTISNITHGRLLNSVKYWNNLIYYRRNY